MKDYTIVLVALLMLVIHCSVGAPPNSDSGGGKQNTGLLKTTVGILKYGLTGLARSAGAIKNALLLAEIREQRKQLKQGPEKSACSANDIGCMLSSCDVALSKPAEGVKKKGSGTGARLVKTGGNVVKGAKKTGKLIAQDLTNAVADSVTVKNANRIIQSELVQCSVLPILQDAVNSSPIGRWALWIFSSNTGTAVIAKTRLKVILDMMIINQLQGETEENDDGNE
ncbi:uncharacterized protein LOC129004793 [Macrosteles quadrilineatus]|uniref:uncharacterized protein LOC129004793 n=1 Tax=Macrosteles quadrilineatus TaxID=74068 RepID=UPI0023E33CCE|nr:uncharacterized protein LOC129004793 [Macrosteles quadrilineatus]